jgi:hypothetical protein
MGGVLGEAAGAEGAVEAAWIQLQGAVRLVKEGAFWKVDQAIQI